MSGSAIPKTKWRAGVLGATGMVGQRIVKMLEDHPWFELTEVVASERSSGKRYRDAMRWHLAGPAATTGEFACCERSRGRA